MIEKDTKVQDNTDLINSMARHSTITEWRANFILSALSESYAAYDIKEVAPLICVFANRGYSEIDMARFLTILCNCAYGYGDTILSVIDYLWEDASIKELRRIFGADRLKEIVSVLSGLEQFKTDFQIYSNILFDKSDK